VPYNKEVCIPYPLRPYRLTLNSLSDLPFENIIADTRYACDSCSSKRILADGIEFRVTDGQFLLARVDKLKEETERSIAFAEQERVKALELAQAQTKADQEAKDQANRESLFGNMLGQASQLLAGKQQEEEEEASRPANRLEGLASSLSETRNALLERGQKLSDLNDKSAQMVEASSDFARMAKELRRKTESKGIFW